MSTQKVDAKQAKFILGMKSPGPDADALEEQVRSYLQAEARISPLVQKLIASKPARLPSKTTKLISTLKTTTDTTVEKSEGRELLEQMSDVMDGVKEIREAIAAVASAAQAGKSAAVKASPAYRAAEQCLTELARSRPQLEKAITAVGVAKEVKGHYDLQSLLSHCEAVLAVAVLAHGIAHKIAKLAEDVKQK